MFCGDCVFEVPLLKLYAKNASRVNRMAATQLTNGWVVANCLVANFMVGGPLFQLFDLPKSWPIQPTAGLYSLSVFLQLKGRRT